MLRREGPGDSLTGRGLSCGQRVTIFKNSIVYTIGAGIPWAVFGAVLGAVAGGVYATYTDPCVSEPNDHAVNKCAWGSGDIGYGAAVGAGIFTFIAVLIAGGYAYQQGREMQQKGFVDGLSESTGPCLALGGFCLDACSR